jgi:CHAD domain-containing protein
VIRRLDADREAARVEMLATIGHRRYMNLRDMMAAAAIHVPCTTPAYATPAAVLAAEVRDGWTKLRKSVRRLGERPADDALHRVRVRAKRTRYAAEACVPAFGKRARGLANAMASVQDILGEHHDAVVAGAWIAKTAHECTPGEAYALGMLAETERASARAAGDEFPAVWEAASRKRLRAWL